MKKAFFDLCKGDSIYYYDKFKIHEQKIHDIKFEVNNIQSIDWYGNPILRQEFYLTIIAGKNTKLVLKYYHNPLDFNLDCIENTYNIFYTYWRGMPRFSNYSEATEYIKKLKNKHQVKANKLKEKLEKEEKLINKYVI